MEDHTVKLDDIIKDVSNPTIETLISPSDFNDCGIDCTSLNNSSNKKIAAQTFANYIYDKYSISTQTKKNFDLLFAELK